MPITLSSDNPNVFVCRDGHVSREANGIDHFTCKKIIVDENYDERPCRLKAILIDEEFAHALHERGWKKRTNYTKVLLTRLFDEIIVNGQATIGDASKA